MLTLEPESDAEHVLVMFPLARVCVEGRGQRRRSLLFHAGAPPFWREVSTESRAVVSMPAGPVVAVTLDREDAVVGLAFAVAVQHRETVVTPSVTQEGFALVAFLRLPANAPSDVKAELLLAGSLPQASAATSDGSLHVWRSSKDRQADLTLRSEDLFVEPRTFHPRDGEIQTVRLEARLLPTLTAIIELPEAAASAWAAMQAKLRIQRSGQVAAFSERTVAKAGEYRFERLDPGRYELVVDLGDATVVRSADLSDGLDRSAVIPLTPMLIEGTVRRGGAGVAARLLFQPGEGKPVSVETDDRGRYELLLWAPRLYEVQIEPADSLSSVPLIRLERLDGDRRLDIDIPENRIVIRIVDEDTSKGIPSARAYVANVWNDGDGGRKRIVRALIADDRGEVTVESLENGSVELRAEAESYLASQPVNFMTDGSITEKQVRVVLKRITRESRLLVRLPDGTPAAGCEAAAMVQATGAQFLWTTSCDHAGEMEIPGAAEGTLLLIRHQASGGMVRRLARGDREWTLPARAARPIVLKVVRGGKPTNQVRLVFWFGETPVNGAAMVFLLRAEPHPSGSGFWRSDSAPDHPLRVLASGSITDSQILAGGYAALAVSADWRAAQPIVVEAID